MCKNNEFDPGIASVTTLHPEKLHVLEQGWPSDVEIGEFSRMPSKRFSFQFGGQGVEVYSLDVAFGFTIVPSRSFWEFCCCSGGDLMVIVFCLCFGGVPILVFCWRYFGDGKNASGK